MDPNVKLLQLAIYYVRNTAMKPREYLSCSFVYFSLSYSTYRRFKQLAEESDKRTGTKRSSVQLGKSSFSILVIYRPVTMSRKLLLYIKGFH